MSIQISNTQAIKKGTRTEVERVSYVANRVEDCRDSIDAIAFELAIEHGDTITIGQVIASPA